MAGEYPRAVCPAIGKITSQSKIKLAELFADFACSPATVFAVECSPATNPRVPPSIALFAMVGIPYARHATALAFAFLVIIPEGNLQWYLPLGLERDFSPTFEAFREAASALP